jgi:hypothetical protein
MSGKKRKSALLGVQGLHDSITGTSGCKFRAKPIFTFVAFVPLKELLLQIKPKLSGDKAHDATLVTQLHKLANLAESFTELRPRSNKTWLDLADNLDREGEYCIPSIERSRLTAFLGNQ